MKMFATKKTEFRELVKRTRRGKSLGFGRDRARAIARWKSMGMGGTPSESVAEGKEGA